MSAFVDGLREQLVAAAEREQQRRTPRLVVPALRPVLVAAAGAAIAGILILAVAGGLRTEPGDRERPAARPAAEGRDLFGGELEPGVRYRTRAFVPPLSFAVPGAEWFAADTMRPDRLTLDLFTPRDEHGYRVLLGAVSFVHLTRVHSPAVPGLRASLISAPVDLYAWLRRHPDLRVGPPERTTVAGVPGRSFTVEVRFDRPVHSDPFCRRRYQITCTLISPGTSFPDGTRMRLTILPTQPEPLIISVASSTSRRFEKLAGPAAQLVGTLRIGVPTAP